MLQEQTFYFFLTSLLSTPPLPTSPLQSTMCLHVISLWFSFHFSFNLEYKQNAQIVSACHRWLIPILLYSFYEWVLSFQYNKYIYLLFFMWEQVFVIGFLERFTMVSAYIFQNSLSIISKVDYVEPVSHQIIIAHSICSEYLTTPILDHSLSLVPHLSPPNNVQKDHRLESMLEGVRLVNWYH